MSLKSDDLFFLSQLALRVSAKIVLFKPGDTAEMTWVAGHELQIMAYGCGDNLKIRTWKDCSCFLKTGPDFAKDFSGINIIRQDGYRWENALFHAGWMSTAGLETVGAFV